MLTLIGHLELSNVSGILTNPTVRNVPNLLILAAYKYGKTKKNV